MRDVASGVCVCVCVVCVCVCVCVCVLSKARQIDLEMQVQETMRESDYSETDLVRQLQVWDIHTYRRVRTCDPFPVIFVFVVFFCKRNYLQNYSMYVMLSIRVEIMSYTKTLIAINYGLHVLFNLKWWQKLLELE